VAAPARLIRTLQDTFGPEAADDLVTWMHAMETSRSELRDFNELNFVRFDSRMGEQRHWMEAQFALFGRAFDGRLNELRDWATAEFAAVRSEMKDEFAAVRSEMKDEFAAVRSEMKDEFAAVRSEMRDGFDEQRKQMQEIRLAIARLETRLDTRIEQRFADLLKWSFVFWVGTAISLAVLMR
jgi:ribosomal protein L29